MSLVDEETAHLLLGQLPQIASLVCPTEDGRSHRTYRRAVAEPLC